ncbi:hypothetical protein EX895_004022 [Sporisorium graminicola]|uniref:Uncharacterized protein n=1 Tax=Sporisorium graminicola TaxID=280036 RepID=A0A4U7KS09_9BASI|nr:hypothetical protein EX895_004022 [Sporisorium graminicola]TKY87345.1 hypothetical protein EX895_004022 [Sporisorium graminicola]
MSTIARASAFCSPPTSSDEYVLDPRKSMPDYRREIYDLLQYLDEEQDKIEKQLARFSSPAAINNARKHAPRRASNSSHQSMRDYDDVASSESEDESEDDFVVVEDINAASRKKQLLSQLQQLWRTRDALRKRAKQLNIRIDSLAHGKGSGLMPLEDVSQGDVDFDAHDDNVEV